VGAGAGGGVPGQAPHRVDEVLTVQPQQVVLVEGRGADLVDAVAEQAGPADQVDGQLDPDRRERVALPEVVAGDALVPDERDPPHGAWTLPGHARSSSALHGGA
jgi:hypothetical protein